MNQEQTQFSNLSGKINFQFRPGVSCDFHRVELPFTQMDIQNGATDSQLTVYNRLSISSPTKDYIIDIDDFWYLYPHHYIYPQWNAGRMSQKIVDGIKQAKYVTVTNHMLYDRVHHYNKNVLIIENSIPFGQGQYQVKAPIAGTRFFWGGGASHEHDLSLISPISHDRSMGLTIMGVDSRPSWQNIKNILGSNGTNYISAEPIDRYMNAYDGNIMLAPLENNYFNQHKSSLRILEAACKGMMVIASFCEPYIGIPGVMYANNSAEFYDHAKYCIKNPGFVYESACMLQEYAIKNYHMKDANVLRAQLYSQFI